MSTLYDSFTGAGTTAQRIAYGTAWEAQTFTTTDAYTAESVKLILYRVLSPGTITASIRGTTAGKPSGEDLASGTLNGNDFSDSSPGEWYEFVFTEGCDLEDATVYAIVIRATSGDSSNYVASLARSGNAYADGSETLSTTSGSTWGTLSTNYDFKFEIWGSPLVTYSELSGTCSGIGSGSGDLELKIYIALSGTCIGGGAGLSNLELKNPGTPAFLTTMNPATQSAWSW